MCSERPARKSGCGHMLSPTEYADLDALGLAELVGSGQVSPTEVVQAAIAAIDMVNPSINAVVTRMDDHAIKAAADPEVPARRFAGAPCVLKDEMHYVPGAPTGFGTRLSDGVPAPSQETELMRRYRQAGIVVVGKANLPELGASVTSEPVKGGVTRNPWQLDRTVGGSSGGSAAAVAAGLVPFAYGNDGAGSLRIPASCTGTFGFKPSRGRVPSGPLAGEFWNGLVCEHAITRSVRDSAALLDATDGPDVGAPYHAPPKEGPYLAAVGEPPGSLRIGWTTESPHGSAVEAACRDACLAVAGLLETLGHQVEEAAPAYDGEQLVRVVSDLLSIHLANDIDGFAAQRRLPPQPDELEPCTLELAARGRNKSATDLLGLLAALNDISRSAAPFWSTYDLLLTPTLGQRPVAHGYITPTLPDPDTYLERWFTFAPFTPIANVTGQPSMSVPLCWDDSGLPIGVTLTGGAGSEATLFRLAAQLEAAQPWDTRRPPHSVWGMA